ncbi:Uncharacterized conserved protein [Plasmopara halstedii]|uniref:Cilia- and flagella-associated protein 36 n=1 Tax=Plasmopara halstedii TaxID=4781 RepID=A0A0N7L7N2_PLAHL|nr:Uncharacterized conserved protein [Plasmopara halstedii]CEG47547.1 Uncharacterized conserved protein [Plasmopara halstedii]|eukprot:XP_024583916.1 Uncharacterized conserved protein [Plasmopara halstedii]
MAASFTTEESDWVFDYVLNLLHSPAWELPVMCFIDENCASFDLDEENKFIYTELHAQFREVIENVLGSHLAELGLAATDFAALYVINQILAMDDFLSFKRLMIKRNLELELKAIKKLREEGLEDEHDLETQFMELSVLYKQEEMEQVELDAALAMSMVVQGERLRPVSVATKVAEDKHSRASHERVQLSPVDAQQQILENKKVEEACKKNKNYLEAKRNEWQQTAGISELEVKRRKEYLQKQRDLLIEKKKREREAQLKDYQQEQKATAPEPPTQLVEKIKNSTLKENKNTDEEERIKASRIALVRRIKQDLLESSNLEAPDCRTSSFKMHQVFGLGDKLQRVKDLRRLSQEQENKVQAKLRLSLQS